MKKYISLILFSAFCVAACKKDKAPVQNVQGKQDVTIKVNFSKVIEPYTTSKVRTNAVTTTAADTAITNHAQVLYYSIFDATGKVVQTVSQKASNSDFGSFSAKLDPGTYTVAIAAGGPTVKYEDTNLQSAGYYSYPDIGNSPNPIGEFYFKKMTITVGNTAVNQNVLLDRVSSLIVVKLTDQVPASITGISLRVDKVGYGFSINNAAGEVGAMASAGGVGQSVSDHANFTLVYPLIIASPTVNVDLTAGNATGSSVQRTINNVPVAVNTVTTITGALFGGSPSDHGMKVTLDSTWTNVYKPF